MRILRTYAFTLLIGGAFLSSAVQAQELTLQDLLDGETITADDKVFSNWLLDDFELGPTATGSLNDIFVTPLEDDPLNPGVKFNIPNGLGSGGSFALLQFSFDVQTASGEPLIKDNSLLLNGFEVGPTQGLVNIFESVSDVAGAPLGFKFVQALPGDVPNSGDPDHFDSAEFAPQSFVHVEKIVEVLGPSAELTMFEQRFSQVPEPASVALLAMGLIAMWLSGARKMRGRLMTKHIAMKSLFTGSMVAGVLLSLLIATAANAASAKFTASGSPNFPIVVNYSLVKTGGDSFSNAINFGAGVSANNVVTEMNFQMENLSNSSFSGTVSGNMLTVDDISSAWVSSGGSGLDMWVDLDTMADPCTGCMLDLPAAADLPPPYDLPSPARTLVLTLGDADGQVVPIQSAGVLDLGLGFADDPDSPTFEFDFQGAWTFSSGMTTADLNQAIDNTLRNTSFPSGVDYVGLVGGFPMIAHDVSVRMLSIRPSISVPDESDPGFLVGVAARGVIPEPSSFVLLAIGVTVAGWSSARRRVA